MLTLLNPGLVIAAEDGGTNHEMGQVRNLLDSAGFSFSQETVRLPRHDTNSFRNVHFTMPGPFAPLVVPVKKNGWNLWDNSSIKSIGREGDQVNMLDPNALLARYEYEITYSFMF